MGYTLIKGGEEAIRAAEELARKTRLSGQSDLIDIPQINEQMRLAVDQVMGEGSLYSAEIAALAVKQAEGDLMEAAFLVRAYRTTLSRIGYSIPDNTDKIAVIRRISSTFKDVPGGQILGATRDYTPHLLNFALLKKEAGLSSDSSGKEAEMEESKAPPVRVVDLLRAEGLVKNAVRQIESEPFDITREAISFPAPRSARLQALARGESGAMLCLAYSSLRGFGAWHPTIAELRVGYISVSIIHPYTGAEVSIGSILVTECESIAGAQKSKKSGEAKFSLGYGLVFGHNERKAISMSILDGTTSSSEKGNHSQPAADQEFIFYHIDAVDAMGFVEHLKLPHYVDFQSALNQARQTRIGWASKITGRN